MWDIFEDLSNLFFGDFSSLVVKTILDLKTLIFP